MQTNWTNALNKDVVNMMLLEPAYPPCRDTGSAAPPTPLEKPRSYRCLFQGNKTREAAEHPPGSPRHQIPPRAAHPACDEHPELHLPSMAGRKEGNPLPLKASCSWRGF